MKRWLWLALLLLPCAMHAQVVGPGFINYVTSAPSGTCSQGEQMRVVIGLGTVYTCQNGTWAQVGGSAGVAFSALTTGTNTTAAMVVGPGASFASTPEVDIGAVGTVGVLGLKGNTSGTATITAPAIAGTPTNLMLFSNSIQTPFINVTSNTLPSGAGIFAPSSTVLGLSSASGIIRFYSGGTDTVDLASGVLEPNSAGSASLGVSGGCCNWKAVIASYFQSAGTKYTLSANACSATTTLGGASAGSFLSGTTGVCAVTVTMGDTATAATGWACYASNHTTPANIYDQTGAASTTTASFSGTTVSGDLITFGCEAY